MTTKQEDVLANIIEILIFSVIVLFIIGSIAFEIWIYVTYGNKPYDEVPPWVWWFMLGGRK